ncbi:nicotinate-nucleotide adenylyltransferase [Paenibacillus sp. J2TS4]|uniref:nicotinate-nucleotide adenylyltransferase n=1 Tax=Paenibacillus sp. J2TS4 TaxID=2807194 RepID=UPI001B20EDE3|nr:nicotinate-nucleotide adenylyltransferase [Paenibacillus sp. J2TS4]GIP35888.1 putative nicotinate-nucleotide adenylyltransferase [Paenibacillus sp. J2TS4]
MLIGIMGGTFDPIHIGHLLAAETAAEEANLDEVWFMPANIPPHKASAPLATSQQRLEMVQCAIESRPSFKAIDDELKRGGTSYTFDTVARLQQQYPDYRFHYIIGADMVMYLPKWYRIEELAQLVTFIGVGRPGYELNLTELPPALRDRVQLVSMPAMEVSSTDIRKRRQEGRSIRYRVPESVRQYIERKGLYES